MKKKYVIYLLIILLVAGVAVGLFKLVEHNNLISGRQELINADQGTFVTDIYMESLYTPCELTLFDNFNYSDWGKDYKEEFGIDIKLKGKVFIYKPDSGSMALKNNLIYGTWERNPEGDYELTNNDGKLFARIFKRADQDNPMPKYVIDYAGSSKFYSYMVKKTNLPAVFTLLDTAE